MVSTGRTDWHEAKAQEASRCYGSHRAANAYVSSSNSDTSALNDDFAVVCVEYGVTWVYHGRYMKPRHFGLLSNIRAQLHEQPHERAG